MADRLSVYNGVMDLIGEEPLGSLNDAVTARRKVDAVYTKTVQFCLSKGPWGFATRTVRVDSNPALELQFGQTYAFDHPENMARLVGIMPDEMGREPLQDYFTERAYWYTNIDPIYVRYVDQSTDFGFDLSLWHRPFQLYVEAELAAHVAQSIRESKVEYCMKLAVRRLADAEGHDGIGKPTEPKPTGSWRRRRYARGDYRFSDNRS